MYGLTKIPYGFDRAKESAQCACKKSSAKVSAQRQSFLCDKNSWAGYGQSLKWWTKTFSGSRGRGDGAEPVANLTGRARQYRRPDYTGTARRVAECTGRGEAGWRILRDGPRGAPKFHAPYTSALHPSFVNNLHPSPLEDSFRQKFVFSKYMKFDAVFYTDSE